jgi:O-antigen/teichoic acid export membrane protein
MSTTAYIAAAWIGTFVAVGVYTLAVVRRGRRLSKTVPPEQRRWM